MDETKAIAQAVQTFNLNLDRLRLRVWSLKLYKVTPIKIILLPRNTFLV